MNSDFFIDSFLKLEAYCSREKFKGWDPYDGLNSRVFRSLPLVKDWDLARLAWIQAFKRNPLNLRRLLRVPKEYNAKGIGLLLSSYCNVYDYQIRSGKESLIPESSLLKKIQFLAELLLSMQSKGYSGSCWGYNFDWQARRLFFFPRNTPTVVVTSFCSNALFAAYEMTGERRYLETALSSGSFVLNDLKRTPRGNGFLFSYSPVAGNNTVYNASLLGSRLLSQCFYHTKDEIFRDAAFASALACAEAQNPDGSWFYGDTNGQRWIDSFHTGYNLESLALSGQLIGTGTFYSYIDKGFDFYINNFFREDGTPGYYHNRTYPVDIHCPAQLFVTLDALKKFEEYRELAEKVMDWTIKNMQDKHGYFYYQLRKSFNSKISYMRWSNAFMLYGMSCFLLNNIDQNGLH